MLVLSSISKFKGWTAPSWRRRHALDSGHRHRAPRSRLLLLVYLASLSLLLSLGAGLAILASAYVSSSAIAASASADRELVQALVEDLGAIVASDPATETAAGEAVLRRAIEDVGLIGVAIAAPDGSIRMDAGEFAWPSEPRIEFGSERPSAVVAGHGDRSRLVEAFPVMLDEKEFFIRKAIGWVLREAGKRRPGEVAAWLAPRTDRASGVTMREAVKYLPAADSDRLMTAYREHRRADQ